MTRLEIIILAAGQGRRMRSRLPKSLQLIGGRPMLWHILATAQSLRAQAIHIVVGDGEEEIKQSVSAFGADLQKNLHWCKQAGAFGSGHAVQQALPGVTQDAGVLVLNGDMPLLPGESLQTLLQQTARLNMLTAILENPQGFGRVLRDAEGRVRGIVEQKDATPAQQQIREINTNCFFARARDFAAWLEQINNDNAQREYYLTDIVALAAADGEVATLALPHPEDALGANDKVELAAIERIWQRRAAMNFMRAGVRIADPARFDIRGETTFGEDCEVDINVLLAGDNAIGARCRIGAGCVLRDVTLGDDCTIEPFSVLENARAGRRCRIGPFARIRPGADFGAGVHIGNFVEIKQSRIAEDSKVNHLSYIGDSEIGKRVNIGAGVITCNYDGAEKHITRIGDDAFVGSDAQLVAPVCIGEGATIGAGATITRDVAKNKLALARAEQVEIDNWQRPRKKPAGT